MRERVIAEEDIFMIKPSFVRYAFEARFSNSSWRIPRALKVYPVSVDHNALVFRMCRYGNIEGLQVLFSSGSVSPFVLDPSGRSLLHVSAHRMRLELALL